MNRLPNFFYKKVGFLFIKVLAPIYKMSSPFDTFDTFEESHYDMETEVLDAQIDASQETPDTQSTQAVISDGGSGSSSSTKKRTAPIYKHYTMRNDNRWHCNYCRQVFFFYCFIVIL